MPAVNELSDRERRRPGTRKGARGHPPPASDRDSDFRHCGPAHRPVGHPRSPFMRFGCRPGLSRPDRLALHSQPRPKMPLTGDTSGTSASWPRQPADHGVRLNPPPSSTRSGIEATPPGPARPGGAPPATATASLRRSSTSCEPAAPAWYALAASCSRPSMRRFHDNMGLSGWSSGRCPRSSRSFADRSLFSGGSPSRSVR